MPRRLRTTMFSLLATQGAQYLASLIVLPILTRRLGLDAYGELGYCLSLVGYLGLLVEWGYAVTAANQIAIMKDNLVERSRIFWSVWLGKLFLLMVATCFLCIFLQLDFLIIGDHNLLWVCFLLVVANSLSPTFLFHGLEILDVPLGVNVIFRFLSIPFLLIFLRDPSDVTVAQGIVSLALVLSTLTNLFLLKRLRLICWRWVTFAEIFGAMRLARPLFVSTAAQSFFSGSLTVILGHTTGSGAVGAYTAAINFYRAAQAIFTTVSQAFYPRLSALFHRDMEGALRLLRLILLIEVPVSATVCALLAFSSSWLLPILIGHQFDESAHVFSLLTVALFLYGLTNLLGVQLMVLVNCYSFFSRTLLFSIGVSLIIAFPMNSVWGAIGSALAIIMSEASVLFASLVHLKRQSPLVFDALLFRTKLV